MSARAGDMVGGYALIAPLGQGGMGRVWRARHTNPRVVDAQGGDVAVKLIHDQYARNEAMRARFHREVEIGLSLQHPGIVRCFGLIDTPGQLGLVMEFVPGQTLDAWLIAQGGPVPWTQARAVFGQVAAALAYAHTHGVVHRDLKPSNLMRLPDGTIKILDFGIARRRDSKMTLTRSGMGTVDYMAPEQYTHAKAVDARADVYALGLTLYQLLAGRLPWDDAVSEFDVMTLKSQTTLPPPTQYAPDIPANVVHMIQRCIAPDRDQRPADMDAVRQLLAAPLPAPPPEPTPAPAPGPPTKASPLVWIVAAVGVLAAAVLGALSLASSAPDVEPLFRFVVYLDETVPITTILECDGDTESDRVDDLHGGLTHHHCEMTHKGRESQLYLSTEGDQIWAVSLYQSHPFQGSPQWVQDLKAGLNQECGHSIPLLEQGQERLRPINGDVDPFDHMANANGRSWDCGDVVMHLAIDDDATWVISMDDLGPLQRHPELCGTTPLSATAVLALLALAALRRRAGALPCA